MFKVGDLVYYNGGILQLTKRDYNARFYEFLWNFNIIYYPHSIISERVKETKIIKITNNKLISILYGVGEDNIAPRRLKCSIKTLQN